MQTRQLRKDYPDPHYVSAILRYVKELAVRYWKHTQMVSVDDNCIVPVGEPGDLISTGVHPHSHSLALKASKLVPIDHNFHIHRIVASVAFFVNIPVSANDSFFQGKPFVTVKDKVTQRSNILCHTVELASLTRYFFFQRWIVTTPYDFGRWWWARWST